MLPASEYWGHGPGKRLGRAIRLTNPARVGWPGSLVLLVGGLILRYRRAGFDAHKLRTGAEHPDGAAIHAVGNLRLAPTISRKEVTDGCTCCG